MQFIYPLFLLAAAAIAIPIIIHLFYFRRFKKVYFTNVRFLKEVKEETSARSRLRNLLVLRADYGLGWEEFTDGDRLISQIYVLGEHPF